MMRVPNAVPSFGESPTNPERKLNTYQSYFSRVFLASTVSSTPFVYTVAANQQVLAFGYAIGADMGPGGKAGTLAKRCDTNITTAQRTNNGHTVHVTGISLQVQPTSNAGSIVAGIWPECSVQVQFGGGENSFLLGTPSMVPGANGLYGMGQDLVGIQPIPGGRPFFGFFSNGVPSFLNQKPIPEGLEWRPNGNDSSFGVLITTERAFASNFSGATASALVNEAAASGIRGYTYPAAADVQVDILCQLHGWIEGPRSMNS